MISKQLPKIAFLGLFAASLAACGGGHAGSHDGSTNVLKDPDKITMQYPQTKKIDTKDNYFGTMVEDPYRWLENSGGADSTEIEKWLDEQHKLARVYLDALPQRKAILDKLMNINNYEKMGTPFRKGDKYYFFKNDGLQNQSVLYQLDALDAKPKVFLDPNKLSEDGTTSLSNFAFSKDARYFAYAVSEGGSDWNTVYIKDLQTGKILEDRVQWLRYSGLSWYKDGFFYSRYPDADQANLYTKKNEFHQLYYHKIGTAQEEDELVFADRRNPNLMFGATVTEDERLLIISVSESTKGNALYYKRLDKKDFEVTPLIENFQYDHDFVENLGDKLLILTDNQAPTRKLIEVDLKKPEPKNWKTIIPADPKQVLESVDMASNYLLAQYTKDVSQQLRIHELDGKLVQELALPNLVTVTGLNADRKYTEVFYSLQSYTFPNQIYYLDLKTQKSKLYYETKLKTDISNYTAERVLYKSKDGTMVPLTLVYKKGLKKDGKNPVLLYGYGGFNISLMPNFSVSRVPFLDQGGIYAVANIRGGGEFGSEWHKAGTLLQKQNVFDDFIAAAEYLIAEGYTNPQYLAIEGGSNGGLLVGACMTQRPELFRVAIPRVGVLDMLRYQHFTVGRAWATDYGTSENEEQFKYLYKYSPVHNVKSGSYPATLIMTADRDDRVVPAHSFKFAAVLQERQKSGLPILLRLDRKAGHGAGKPISKALEEEADKWAFLFFNMKL